LRVIDKIIKIDVIRYLPIKYEYDYREDKKLLYNVQRLIINMYMRIKTAI